MSGNVQSFASSFKAEILQAYHNLGTTVTRSSTAADAIKAALYYQNSSMGATTTAYTSLGEVVGTGYTASGQLVSNSTAPALSGTIAYWTPSASITWAGLTISSPFDCYLLYNSTQSGRAIATFTFAPQTIAAGTLTITMPANGPTSALLQVS